MSTSPPETYLGPCQISKKLGTTILRKQLTVENLRNKLQLRLLTRFCVHLSTNYKHIQGQQKETMTILSILLAA